MPRTPDQLTMRPFYGFFHYFAQTLYSAWFRGEVVGTENIPAGGPYLLAGNHASHLDPPFIGCQIPRQMRFFARRTLWSNRIFSWWLDRVECITLAENMKRNTRHNLPKELADTIALRAALTRQINKRSNQV